MPVQPPLVATKTVRIAVDTVLLSRPTIAALAGGVHNGHAPQGTPAPYLVYTNPSQGDWGVAGQAGAAGVLFLHAFDPNPDVVEDLLAELVAALHGVRLVVDGLELVVGRVDVLDVSRDPDTENLYHGVAAYRWDALAERVNA